MAAPMKQFLTRIVPQTGERALGSVIFLHGSGDTGQGIQSWAEGVLEPHRLEFPHLRILYPTAPPRPYTAFHGEMAHVWYDKKEIHPSAPDDKTVDHMAHKLSELVKSEVDQGIPVRNIVIGGFSMGGGMALQLGYRYLRDVAGVFAMSSFLSTNSVVFEALQKDSSKFPPLFQSHGEDDPLVLYQWGKDTHQKLTELGVKGEFHSIPNLVHELDKDTLTKLCAWINNRVPQNAQL